MTWEGTRCSRSTADSRDARVMTDVAVDDASTPCRATGGGWRFICFSGSRRDCRSTCSTRCCCCGWRKHGVDIVTVGFFAWVALLPTFKFAWAPLLDKYDVPGFGRFWGKRRGWIMLSQLGIFLSTVAMAFTSSDANLAVTALFAVLLAFWTTTLEVAADAWRIELAPTAGEQGPMVAANLWGYRSAMVAAGQRRDLYRRQERLDHRLSGHRGGGVPAAFRSSRRCVPTRGHGGGRATARWPPG